MEAAREVGAEAREWTFVAACAMPLKARPEMAIAGTATMAASLLWRRG
jgi:hypothetical protein